MLLFLFLIVLTILAFLRGWKVWALLPIFFLIVFVLVLDVTITERLISSVILQDGNIFFEMIRWSVILVLMYMIFKKPKTKQKGK
jgi:hypothetical protein